MCLYVTACGDSLRRGGKTKLRLRATSIMMIIIKIIVIMIIIIVMIIMIIMIIMIMITYNL